MKKTIAIVGLGYVGLPLAVEFGKKRKVIGFDLNPARINELKLGFDKTLEVSKKDIIKSKYLTYTNNLYDIRDAEIFIITVPTPIKKNKLPDLSPIIKSAYMIGSILKPNDIVVFESTVYPGVTEDIIAPILEKKSKLQFNIDFFLGYSPERINPGDKKHKLTNIKKVTSGSNNKTAIEIDNLYKSIIKAGTYRAESIKIAEAAKVIENTQRDLNIALINELSIIFSKMNIDTESVLKAAETKWNFLSFRPGVVGGHCIGVDPYYLTFKSKQLGYDPKVILAGRETNDSMSRFIGKQIEKLFKHKQINLQSSRIIIFGITFKENCPDIRNTKIIDIYNYFAKKNILVDIYDPIADKNEVFDQYKINLINNFKKNYYDCAIFAVKHKVFSKMKIINIKKNLKQNHITYDMKYLFNKNDVDGRL